MELSNLSVQVQTRTETTQHIDVCLSSLFAGAIADPGKILQVRDIFHNTFKDKGGNRSENDDKSSYVVPIKHDVYRSPASEM